MPTLPEAIRALLAAWRLFLGNSAAAGSFDVSARGFFASFAAIPLVLPFVLLMIAAEYTQLRVPDPETFSVEGFVLLRLAAFLIEWLVFLALMVAATRLLRVEARYGAYVVAHNWTAVVIAAAFLVPIGLGGIVGGGVIVTILAVFAYALALRCLFAVATATLGVRPVDAFAIVVLEVVLALLVSGLSNRLLGL
jgi:hypothetical protein